MGRAKGGGIVRIDQGIVGIGGRLADGLKQYRVAPAHVNESYPETIHHLLDLGRCCPPLFFCNCNSEFFGSPFCASSICSSVQSLKACVSSAENRISRRNSLHTASKSSCVWRPSRNWCANTKRLFPRRYTSPTFGSDLNKTLGNQRSSKFTDRKACSSIPAKNLSIRLRSLKRVPPSG